MPDLTRIIKNGFSRTSCGLKKTPQCPSELELGKYLDKSASVSQKDRIERHLANCGYCLDLLVTAKKALKDSPKKPNVLQALNQQKWFILSMLSLGMSFFIKRYFFQFLTLSLIFGLKWALSAEGSRNLVMIFRSLGQKDTADSKKENIFARK
ncbi:MAG: zf-HC2 domain-containing protein [Candidatus Omnitrophota bacterium]|nr:zf-HC2 domain-containing protein [Candidatus Omnitrophota bacterium]